METFLGSKVLLHRGNCLEVLPTLAENSIDSCVTDPPYHLNLMQYLVRLITPHRCD